MLDWPEGSIKRNDQKKYSTGLKNQWEKNISDWPEQSQTSPKITFVRVSSSSPETMLMSHLFFRSWKFDSFFGFLEFRILFYSVVASCGGRVTSQLPSCINQNIRKRREARTHFIPFCLIWNNWIVLKGDLLIILARSHSCPLHIQWPSVQSARHKSLKKPKT